MKIIYITLLLIAVNCSLFGGAADNTGKPDSDGYLVYAAASAYELERVGKGLKYTGKFAIEGKTSSLLVDINKRKIVEKRLREIKALVGKKDGNEKQIEEALGFQLGKEELELAIKGLEDLKAETVAEFIKSSKQQHDLDPNMMFIIKYSAVKGFLPYDRGVRDLSETRKLNEDFMMKYRNSRSTGELVFSLPGFSSDRSQALLLCESKLGRPAKVMFLERLRNKWTVLFAFSLSV